MGTVARKKVEAVPEVGACRKQALRLLALRDRSEAEMREALQKRGYPDTEITGVVNDLKKKRYIDDEAYSKSWASYRMESSPVGPFRLQFDLRKKGFDDNLIQGVSESIWMRYSEFDVALNLAKRKYVRGEDPLSMTEFRRISDFLQRRGFSGEVVGRVLSELRKC